MIAAFNTFIIWLITITSWLNAGFFSLADIAFQGSFNVKYSVVIIIIVIIIFPSSPRTWKFEWRRWNTFPTRGCRKFLRHCNSCVYTGSKFTFGFESTCATRCEGLGALPKFSGAWSKILGAQPQIIVAPTPKEYLLTLEKERLGLCAAIWAYSCSIEHNKNK